MSDDPVWREHTAYANAGELGTPKGWIYPKNHTRRPPTQAGWHIIAACPYNGPGITEHALMERLGGPSDYSAIKEGIQQLVREGYLVLKDGLYIRTE